ncbi:hypothetical protein CI610_00473 [invertebrate metagenome]|uniref:Uncharacterized protein n=1 Tax=invertebrate metagenome TaxID=1711999 RepID=A0A2H9TB81_9ZZZZ
MKQTNYRAGPLLITFKGNSKILDLIKDEFFEETHSSNNAIDLVISVYDSYISDYKPTHYSGKGSMNFNDIQFHIDNDSFYSFEVKNGFGKKKQTELDIFIKRPGFVRELYRILKGIFSIEYNTRDRFIKSNIATYSLLWSVIALCLLKKESSFIHAGVLARNNNAIVLSGTGGCGKTSTVLHLLSHENFEYLSEDFGIVQSDGLAYQCNKSVSLYHSDIKYKSPSAITAYNSMNTKRKLAWFFLSKLFNLNPILKAEPKFLTKQNITQKPIAIKYGVHLSRENISDISIKEINVAEYALRSTRASIRELKPLTEMLNLITANAPDNLNIISVSELEQLMIEIYTKAFSNSILYKMQIPIKMPPNLVSSHLLEALEI